jgi:prophage regulatory protein
LLPSARCFWGALLRFWFKKSGLVGKQFRFALSSIGSTQMQTTNPETNFLRLKQILGDRNAIPPIAPIIPIGKSSWWLGVRTGRYPQPIKLGPKTTVWRATDIQKLLDDPELAKK